jgi:hypothetical protein
MQRGNEKCRNYCGETPKGEDHQGDVRANNNLILALILEK